MVEERMEGRLCINQPAGHLEPGESFEQGVIREAREESGYDFYPSALVGAYLMSYQLENGKLSNYLRFAFTGTLGAQHAGPLDPDIEGTVWMTHKEILANRHRHRSELVLPCIEDYLAGVRVPLSFVSLRTIKQGVR